MKYNNLNIYNNLIKLTRNKKLYLNLEKNDTFSERIVFLFLHLAMFFKHFKKTVPSKNLQELFDFIIRQVELSIREIGYGDVTINKKMKVFVNLFYYIVEEMEKSDFNDKKNQLFILKKFLNTEKNLDFFADYFNKYRIFLTKNTLNTFTKDILNLNF
tara:strand:- start:3497 stop:3970 length:474 start_codon:yes stop_codon:yes gene_type:complete